MSSARIAQIAGETRRCLSVACLLIVGTLAGASGITAQDNGAIEGIVSDRSERPVAEATVLAMNLRSGESWQTSTDTKGAFQFNQLSTGVYRVSVGQSGYEIYESDDLKIEAQKVTRLSVQLKQARKDRDD